MSSRGSSASLTVYYDGGCPLCRREISTYRTMNGADDLDWIDVSEASPETLGPDLSASTAMARMHVRDANGRLIDGAAAFAALWRQFPKTRWLGKIAGTRLALLVLEPAYRAFLKIRPLWR